MSKVFKIWTIYRLTASACSVENEISVTHIEDYLVEKEDCLSTSSGLLKKYPHIIMKYIFSPIENPNLTIINRSCWTWNQTRLVTWACCIPWPLPSFNMVTDKRCHSHLSVIQEIHHPSNWCNIFIPFIFQSYSHCLPVTQHNTSVRLASLHYHPSLKTIITRPYFTDYTTHMSGPSNLWKSI